MSFFKQFPKVEYDFNRTGVMQNMVDIFRAVRPLPSFLDNYSAYKFYEIKNGERPDIVSQRLYGTSQYYWTFFVINDFLHDGMRAWPMSQEDLFTYIEKEYEGYVIETNPVIVRDTDGLITDHRNSLSGRFQLGETIIGGTSNASGTLTKKISDLSQLVIQNVTGGAFIGSALGQSTTELVVGQTSEDSVSTYNVYPYAEAPYYYYETDASTRIERISVTAGGSGYSSAPTITIQGNGSGASAVATVLNGVIISIRVTNKGSGYTSSPIISITGGGGSGGTAKAIINPVAKKPVTNLNHIVGGVDPLDLSYVTNRAHVIEENDEHSQIRYIDPNYINKFVNQFEELING
jgi:hypothetical protein